MPAYFLSGDKIGEFTRLLSTWGSIYRFENTPEGARLKLLTEDEYKTYDFPTIRAAEPAKFIFVKARKKVAEYFNDEWRYLDLKVEPKVVIGLKQCDLKAIKIWDNVFKDDPDYKDAHYIAARENTLLIGADCLDIATTCFCNLMDLEPYPTDNTFDLSLSPVNDGYVLFVGSEKGANAIAGLDLPDVSTDILAKIDQRRKIIKEKLEAQNSKYKTTETYRNLVEKNPDSKSWDIHGSTCVTCAACTYVCPTCFCFSIYDVPGKDGLTDRFIALDSCKYQRFSFMAGGLNPRGSLVERFKHRYNHKFFHYNWRYEINACTGCGRCIENCMGKIDMRETLKDLESK